MCGRYSVFDIESLSERFGVEPQELTPRYNIAPTQQVPVIMAEERRRLSMMRWGLVPHWAKDLTFGSKMINARAETVASKPSFRECLQRRRCLVPADGFFEWRKTKGRKVPYRFTLQDGGLFAMAGLWDRWLSPQGAEVHTFTIITTEANELVGEIHDRMPVILPAQYENDWLEGGVGTDIKGLLVPYPAEQMKCFQVSEVCNSAKNDIPQCVLPVATIFDNEWE